MLLINRHSYSATNDFVNAMRYFPNVTLVGDKTGGGSGLPFLQSFRMVGAYVSPPAPTWMQTNNISNSALIRTRK